MASGASAEALAVVAMVREVQDHRGPEIPLLLLNCLERLTGAGEADVVIRRPRGRRPTAQLDGRTIYLSVSHSAQMAAATASYRPAGIDIERVREVRNVDGVRAHITGFLPRHADATREPDAHAEVLRAWTRYEATVKALGVGRALVPSEFAGNAEPDITFRGLNLPLNLNTATLHTHRRNQHDSYLLSVAARPTSNVVIHHDSDLGYTPANHERHTS